MCTSAGIANGLRAAIALNPMGPPTLGPLKAFRVLQLAFLFRHFETMAA